MNLTNGVLSWPEAEELRQAGIPLDYRDCGAHCGTWEWHVVDGPITEHMSDFEFRVRAATLNPH